MFKNNPLLIKISIALLALLILLGISFAWITSYTAQCYFLESHQKLNANLANFTVDHVNTFNDDGTIDTTAIQDIMHSMMVINPSVEVYLLDTEGDIITYVAPYKKIKRDRVSLEPIKAFIQKKGDLFIQGDDPRNVEATKIFSAAPIMKDEVLQGYYYIVLASEAQASVMADLQAGYALSAGARLFLLTILAAGILSLFVLWYLTRNLSRVTEIMQRFREGDYTARVSPDQSGDFHQLADNYNAMAQRIEENIEKIKSVEQLRRELIANVSHDLRTPLSVIQGYLETLKIKGETLNKEQKEKYLDHIYESSNRLNGLVNQLFELSKLESNHIKINREPFPAQELAQDLVQRYSLKATSKNVSMNVQMDEDLPLVYADVSLVERVFQNLIDNALKYTPEGGTINLILTKQGDQVGVEVQDSGPGIPDKDQKHIFDRYRKSSSEHQVNGTGLGLAIVHKILEIHNSTIRVISAPEKGCRFLFELPTRQLVGA